MTDDLGPLAKAAAGMKRIVEEIDGAMNHGIWRDERGMRLKDTPEWVALYNAISDHPAAPAPVVPAEGPISTLEMVYRNMPDIPELDELKTLISTATPGPWDAALEAGCHGVVASVPPAGETKMVAIIGNSLESPELEPMRFANARLIALAPELAAEVIAHRAQVAKDKARIERLEAALRPFVAYVHYAFHEGNSRFRLVEDFDEGGGWLGSEDFRRARAALEDGE